MLHCACQSLVGQTELPVAFAHLCLECDWVYLVLGVFYTLYLWWNLSHMRVEASGVGVNIICMSPMRINIHQRGYDGSVRKKTTALCCVKKTENKKTLLSTVCDLQMAT